MSTDVTTYPNIQAAERAIGGCFKNGKHEWRQSSEHPEPGCTHYYCAHCDELIWVENLCTCHTCGYQWRRGLSGSHDCSTLLKQGFSAEKNTRERAEALVDKLQQKLDELRIKHEVACQTISTMQAEREQRRAYQVLSSLSLWLAQGSGDGSTTAEQYEKRIRDGVNFMLGVERERREKAEAKAARLQAVIDKGRNQRKNAKRDAIPR